MKIFGLPGEAAAVLIGGWMSMGGAIGVAITLFEKGILTGAHLAILAPAIYLMGSQVSIRWRIALAWLASPAKRILNDRNFGAKCFWRHANYATYDFGVTDGFKTVSSGT